MIRAQILPAISLTIFFTVFTGIVFPLVIWGLAQLCFPHQANGSLIDVHGKAIGSELIGQNFTSPRYFHPRPSAAGNGYDPLSSGGTNLGPTSKKLFEGQPDDPATADADESFQGVKQLAEAYREENGLAKDAILPPDAVTRSASGLDPEISPANAHLQASRIARERNLTLSKVASAIDRNTTDRFLGIFGEPRVNVLKLNLMLDQSTNH